MKPPLLEGHFNKDHLRYGVDFDITLNGEPITDAIAAESWGDDTGTFGWIETPSGVMFGHVEFRLRG